MTQEGDFELTLSFVSLSDDNTTILLNGKSDYAVVLPANITRENAASKMDIIKKLILDGCDKFGIDYVGEDNIRNSAKEVVYQFYERARQLKIGDSVSDIIRMNKGRVIINKAKIIGVSPPYKMITEVTLECSDCKWTDDTDNFKDKPQMSYRQAIKYCPSCSKGYDRHDLHAHLEHVDAKTITIQDIDLRDDLEKLNVILLGEDQTRSVRVGESASITGDVDVLNPTGAAGKKPTTIMYATNIKYEREEETPITQDDITMFQQFATNPEKNVIDELVSMFAPQVIGHSDAKLGILRSAVNVRETKHLTGGIRSRTHTLLAGDPGTAKSMLAGEATKIVPNSRYVTSQHISIKSALAIIDKEVDGSKMLMLGAVPQARNALCSVNEIGSMIFEDQQHLADVLEEGRFTIDKHGIYQEIDSPTTIIATTNPEGGYWNKSFPPSLDQLPIKSNIRDRFDQTYIFEDFQTQEERREYAMRKMEIYQNPQDLKIDYDFLKRYLQYAASLSDPVLTPEAGTMLSDFWILMTEQGYGANRSFDSLVRISRAQARLHLKSEIDADIASEVMRDIQLMFVKMGKRIDPSVENPIDLTYNEIIQYTNTLQAPITFIEAAKHVWSTNNSVKQYLGGNSPKWANSENKRLRHVHERFADGAVVGKIKIGRGGLAVRIDKLNPLTVVKADRQQLEQQQEEGSAPSPENQDGHAVMRSCGSSGSYDQYDLHDHDQQTHQNENNNVITETLISEVIEKVMLDEHGNNKDYFTKDDFVYTLVMRPNEGWTEDQAEQTFYALVEEGKLIEEIEPGKFKPPNEDHESDEKLRMSGAA